MPIEFRGGIPRVFRANIAAGAAPGGGYDPAGHRFPATTKSIRIRNYGANVLRVYFLKEDFEADANYLEIAPTAIVSEPMELERIWLRAVSAATDVEILSITRRG